jgi:DNA-binding response OmpR family regulator
MASERLDPSVSILTAESDPWAKASLRRIFKEFQFSNISYTEDVYKTTHQGRFEKYSLLLIGSGLDKGDAVKVVGQIRGDGKNKKAPIIFMFGEGEEEAAKEAITSGADGTILRPVGEPEFRELMEKLLEKFILTASAEAEQNQENLSATSSGVDRGQQFWRPEISMAPRRPSRRR